MATVMVTCRVSGPGGTCAGVRCGTLSDASSLGPVACPGTLFMCHWRWLHDETPVGEEERPPVTQKVAGQGQPDAYLACDVGLV